MKRFDIDEIAKLYNEYTKTLILVTIYALTEMYKSLVEKEKKDDN